MSTIVVRGTIADHVRAFRQEREDIGDAVASYVDIARTRPEALDIATLAVALEGTVQFTKGANAVFIAELERGEDAEFSLEKLRAGIESRPPGATIIAACERGNAIAALGTALAVLFIEEHPKLVEVEEPETTEYGDGEDDDEDDVHPTLPDEDDGGDESDAGDQEE